MLNQKRETIKSLEKIAQEVLKYKQEIGLRRPILIEFCGSPKSGKTSCINSLNIFLKRNGFKTVVLTERASICPIEQKMHPYFNIWTSCSAIAEIVMQLNNGKDSLDVIIADRAIFDALCWFEWLTMNPTLDNPYLDMEQFNSLRSFLTINILRRNIDLVYAFKAEPATSLEREYSTLLTEKRGSIMNEKILNSYNIAINEAIRRNESIFKIEVIDTTNIDQNEVSLKVTTNILNILKGLLIEKIGYFTNEIKEKIKDGKNRWNVIQDYKINFDQRDSIEKTDCIQPIPIAVITNQERTKVLVLKKNEVRVSKDSPEKDKLLLYVGGHVRLEDQDITKDNMVLDTIRNALSREIQEELNESIAINDNLEPFLIYTPKYSPKSAKHLAICFIITMDLENKKFNPTPLEFIQKSGSTKSGHILPIKNFNPNLNEFDSWNNFKRSF